MPRLATEHISVRKCAQLNRGVCVSVRDREFRSADLYYLEILSLTYDSGRSG